MSQKIIDFKDKLIFSSILLLIVLVFSFALFRITGVRIVLGIVFISLPIYLILNNFELGEGEKFVFSIMLGLTIFPSLVYLLGLVISFRIAIIITFLIIIATAFALRKYKKF